MKNKVTVSAPGKLMLFGEQSVVWGHYCLVTALSNRITLQAAFGQPGRNSQFIQSAIDCFANTYHFSQTVDVRVLESFSSLYGLGSSSAVCVATIKALAELSGKKLERKDIFKCAYQTVLKVQGVGSGFDVASAVWGGTILFKTGGEVIEPVPSAGLPIIIAYTGIKADTATMVKKVARIRNSDRAGTETIFCQIDQLVQAAKTCLRKQDWPQLGRLANANQELLAKILVSTDKIDKLAAVARDAGAWGAKLSGAGGGDCIISWVDNKKRLAVERALEQAGGEIIRLKTGAEGVRIEL